MFPSAEVRWFLPGSPPETALRWYAAVAGAPGWEERTDRYVRPSSPADLNVKWREGHLEVKRRVASGAPESLGPAATAPVERWRKWRFPLADPALHDPQGDWVAVAKRRQVRLFAAGDDGVRALGERETAPLVCAVELALLEVGERTWWSVCLEAYGGGEVALPEALRRVAAVVFGPEAPALPAGRARAYVAWLAEEVG